MLIQWNDLNDRPLNDPTKYIVLKEFEQNPSLQGLAPELEYFQENIPFEYPVADFRLVTILDTITFTEDIVVVDGLDVRVYKRTYTVEDRTNEEKDVTIEEMKNDANIQVFPPNKHLEYLTMYAIIVRREFLGLTITPTQQAILDKVEAKGLKMWQNHITEITKKQAVIDNQPLNIDEDWETIDPEDE